MLTPGQRPAWWLAWASLSYACGIRLRTYGYDRGWLARRQLPVPVISIGNLTVGGTGKTPLVIELTQWLLEAGRRVAVLSRGYKRTSREPWLLVSDGTKMVATAEAAGDEPFLIAQRCPRAIVAVGADRYRSGCRILDRCPVDCILLDDGFQHLGLYRDIDLLLLDATDTQGLKELLPAGRLREPMTAAKRATAVIVTRAEKPIQVDAVMTRLRGAVDPVPTTAQVVFRVMEVVSLSTGRSRPGGWCRGKKALLVSGVGHSGSFRATADTLGISVLDEVIYPDHYRYTGHEVARLEKRVAELNAELVLTTEKDAGKIQPFLAQHDDRWWAARLQVEWLTGASEIRKLVTDVRSTAMGGGRA